MDASEIVLQRGSQPVLVFLHPQFAGLGSSCIGVKALFQQIDWYLARLICCLSTSQVGGRFSRLCEQVFPTIINSHDITCTII